MARPIKDTPILRGRDALAFLANFNSPTKKESLSEATRQRMRENFEKINTLVVRNSPGHRNKNS
jgi:hypothetical protein